MLKDSCLLTRSNDGGVGFGSCDIQQIWLSGPEKIVVLAKYKSTSSVSFFRLTAYDITKTNHKKKKIIMNFKDDEEAFNLLNHLMEKFQQMDLKQQGCNFNFVYVASGATHIENQNIISPHKPFSKGEGGVETESIRYPFAPNKDGGKEERFRHCITLLMAEHYGDEPLFCLQAHWQAVYRILVDKGYCRDSDFDGFDVFIQRVMPEEVNKPYKKESVKQISKTDFVLPFKRWRYDPQTSTTRKPFDRMVAVAQRFMAILEENGL